MQGKIFSFYTEQCAGDTRPPTKYSFNLTKISCADSPLTHETNPKFQGTKRLVEFLKE